jgi:general stress protein 26
MLKTLTLFALLGSAVVPVASNGQGTTSAAERARIVQGAKDVMKKAHYAALITLGEDGHPQSRTVDPFAPEDGLTVWIATNPITRKVGQIKKDARVTLYYFDPSGPGYVTLLGKAELVSSAAEKKKRWKEEWSAFYKNKNRGDDYQLIRVKPFRLEIVSIAAGIGSDPKAWRPVIISLP